MEETPARVDVLRSHADAAMVNVLREFRLGRVELPLRGVEFAEVAVELGADGVGAGGVLEDGPVGKGEELREKC